MTGPSYPSKGEKIIDNVEINYSLPRSAETGHPFSVIVPFLNGHHTYIAFKRYKTNDKLTFLTMKKMSDSIKVESSLPELPTAGKYAYTVYYEKDNHFIPLTKNDVIARFKNHVPVWVLILHILFMFAGMLFSNLAGLLAIAKKVTAYYWSKWTLIFMFTGGFILGPIVQKYAFGEFWTGFPFGYDLTDNKILLIFLVWLIAFFLYKKTKNNRWFLFASLVTFVIYLIPHSLFGSELNYTTGVIQQGSFIFLISGQVVRLNLSNIWHFEHHPNFDR
jgi:hypothetical protein